MAPDESDVGENADGTSSWRELAVARSLDPARVRAEKRVQRFLDAAQELMNESTTRDFTVQQVVERSGQSLRSFYQYFAGKYELLLALFEESVRTTAVHLEAAVAEEDEALARLHRFAMEYYRICRPARGKAAKKQARNPSAIAEFAQQLLTEHPKEASRAFAPLVAMLVLLLDEAAATGELRSGLDHRRIAGIVLQAIMFNAFSATIAGTSLRDDTDVAAEEAWGLIFQGIRAA